MLDRMTALLRLLPAETAHRLSVAALGSGLLPLPRLPTYPRLRTRVFGLDFANPLGLAAGFDKNGDCLAGALRLGFGFAEAGTVTPRPQPGNPKPRLFRLPEDRAVINRLGFNNKGLEHLAARLSARPRGGIIGANIGRNKDAEDAVADYVAGARALSPLCDYLVVNVSSPNTPGLRDLQRRGPLTALVGAVREARDAAAPERPPPLLLKVAPDLDEDAIADIVAVARSVPVEGLIVSNTTVARPPSLRSPAAVETGGLSGRPLFEPSTRVLAAFHAATGGGLPLIGVGGVSSAAGAYAKIKAGASLVQLYTALVYEGPGLVARILKDLDGLLAADGHASIAAAVGSGRRSEGGEPS
ncbi:MAG: quinone-dependent dihydroorotate dehydrogenase [Thalassobaculales bacterium]